MSPAGAQRQQRTEASGRGTLTRMACAQARKPAAPPPSLGDGAEQPTPCAARRARAALTQRVAPIHQRVPLPRLQPEQARQHRDDTELHKILGAQRLEAPRAQRALEQVADLQPVGSAPAVVIVAGHPAAAGRVAPARFVRHQPLERVPARVQQRGARVNGAQRAEAAARCAARQSAAVAPPAAPALGDALLHRHQQLSQRVGPSAQVKPVLGPPRQVMLGAGDEVLPSRLAVAPLPGHLAAGQVQQEVGGVDPGGDGEAQRLEVVHRRLRSAVVNRVALAEQQQLVQLLVQAGRGLVDGGGHRAAAAGQLAQHAQQVHGGGGVQPRGGLVQQQQRGVDQQLVPHGDALALAAGDAAAEEAADDGVAALGEAQRGNGGVHARQLVGAGHGARQAQHGGVVQRLVHRQRLVQQVVLHHVAHAALLVLGQRGAVEQHRPLNTHGALGAAADDGQQGCFACGKERVRGFRSSAGQAHCSGREAS